MHNVLFLCTGNSARSVIGEALLNHSDAGRGTFRGYSAGSRPKGTVHPLALEVLSQHQVSIADLRSKGWDEFAVPGAPTMDFVFTVCDQAAAEECPIWPGHPLTAHWGIPDPAAVVGTREEQQRAFADTFVAMRRRIDLFTSLPVESLTRLALQQKVREIGER
jgi:protein-tyrosine-phosphatase